MGIYPSQKRSSPLIPWIDKSSGLVATLGPSSQLKSTCLWSLKWVFTLGLEEVFSIDSVHWQQLRLDNDTVSRFAGKVSLVPHAAIVLPLWSPQLQTGPDAWCKVHTADILHDAHFLKQKKSLKSLHLFQETWKRSKCVRNNSTTIMRRLVHLLFD